MTPTLPSLFKCFGNATHRPFATSPFSYVFSVFPGHHSWLETRKFFFLTSHDSFLVIEPGSAGVLRNKLTVMGVGYLFFFWAWLSSFYYASTAQRFGKRWDCVSSFLGRSRFTYTMSESIDSIGRLSGCVGGGLLVWSPRHASMMRLLYTP